MLVKKANVAIARGGNATGPRFLYDIPVDRTQRPGTANSEHTHGVLSHNFFGQEAVDHTGRQHAGNVFCLADIWAEDLSAGTSDSG